MKSAVHKQTSDIDSQELNEASTDEGAATELIPGTLHIRDTETNIARNEPPNLAQARTLREYAALLKGKSCRWCGTHLRGWIEHYDHNGGWEVSGCVQKQWLYTTCPKCKYQWNLGKLGIPR